MSNILVIEDNISNSRMVNKLLTKAGHTVFVAETGEAGLNSAIEHTPDLILIDLGLPDLDGQTVIGLLRLQPALNNTKLIAFTAYPETTAHKMAEAYGCDGVIIKPINTRTFVGEIAKYLSIVSVVPTPPTAPTDSLPIKPADPSTSIPTSDTGITN